MQLDLQPYNLKCLQKSDCFELISFNWSLDLNSVPSNEIWLIYIYILQSIHKMKANKKFAIYNCVG